MESLDFAAPRSPSAEDVGDVARRARACASSGAERGEIAALIATRRDAADPARAAWRRARGCAASIRSRSRWASGEPLITGVIDLLAREPDGSRAGARLQERPRRRRTRTSPSWCEREYGVQRLLYALAVLRDGAVAVEIVHWFLERPRSGSRVRYTAAERPSSKSGWRGASRARARGASPSASTPTAACA